jgi:hypothetical protein
VPGQAGGATAPVAGPGGRGPVVPLVQLPTLVPGPGGALCVTVVTVPQSTTTPTVDLLDRLWLTLLASHNFCPGVTPPAGITPAIAAQAFWRSIPLPTPHPYIAPGWAITGKTAYLETNGVLHPAPWTTGTPLGPLTITATGAYFVDWGDPSGTWSGPFNHEGAAWPNGTITHVYDFVGNYAVTVAQLWTATWTLGNQHGTLTQLLTQATIAGFPVQQVQAVIVG